MSTRLRRAAVLGRILLGIVAGGSFGVAIGALVASWVYGVAAIGDEAVAASYLAAGITVGAAAIGGWIGYRTSPRSGSGADIVSRSESPR